ncbi:MAG: hypothetical protein HYZ26_13965 [Chloroflexi bacterium]|nr:hypothetical protein [Chloroflexota bacterium]
MFKSNVFRIIVLLAIVAGSLSLGVRPAAAAVVPPEYQDPEWVCENFFGGYYAGDLVCVFTTDTWYYGLAYYVSQGFYLSGFSAYVGDFWEELGCPLDEGIAFEMAKYQVGPYPGQYVYDLYKFIGCYVVDPGVGDRTGDDEGAGTLSLKPPRNGMMNYAAGTCDANNCRITPNLPHGAAADLGTIPGGADATLYVNLGGGTGSYTVCFYGEGTIYQYISGLWQSIATSIGGGKSCASASGDGSFAFSEN